MSDLSRLLGKVYRSPDGVSEETPAAPVDETWAPEQVEQLAQQEIVEEQPPTFDEEWAALATEGLVAEPATPEWADEETLDQAFADWVPGPDDSAPAVERELFDGSGGWAQDETVTWSDDETVTWTEDETVAWADDETAAWTDEDGAGWTVDDDAAGQDELNGHVLTTIDWSEDDVDEAALDAWFDDREQAVVARDWLDEGGDELADAVDWVDDAGEATTWFEEAPAAESVETAEAGWSFGEDTGEVAELVPAATGVAEAWRRLDDDVLPAARRRFSLRRRR